MRAATSDYSLNTPNLDDAFTHRYMHVGLDSCGTSRNVNYGF